MKNKEKYEKLAIKQGASVVAYHDTLANAVEEYIETLEDEELETYKNDMCSLSVDTYENQDFFYVGAKGSVVGYDCNFVDVENWEDWYWQFPKDNIIYNADTTYFEIAEESEESEEPEEIEELEKRTSFNIKPSIWKVFKKKAKKNNSDASKELRKFIGDYVK